MEEVIDAARVVVQKLQKAGHTTYFAGGWVRDFLMQHPSDDIDIATTASVEEMQTLFEKTIPVGIAFGILIIVEQGHHFEVATFRTERGYIDGRRPTEITPATPQEDALRRDFTINGMYYDPLCDELIDYVEGQKDLRKKVIRAIGDPNERFKEDRLRMIRAVRYAARFSFEIEAKTQTAIIEHSHLLFPAVAIERVWSEFTKMAKFLHFDIALGMLHRLGLLDTIFPQLQNAPFELILQRCAPIQNCPKNTPPILLVMHLFPDYTLEEKVKMGRSLKISKKELKYIEDFHLFSKLLRKESPTPYEIASFLAHPDSTLYLAVFSANMEFETRKKFIAFFDHQKQKYSDAINRIISKTPIVSAEDLLKTGITKGPELGKLLKKAEEISVNESLSTKEAIISRLKDVL